MKFKIYKPAKSAMQSGKKNKKWILTPVEENKTRSINPLMGWTSSNDTQTQIKISFSSKEEAIAYANNKGFDYKVEEETTSQVKPKSYAQNFTG
ncbi:MAG: ETC complex I subunit [Pelagibacterales bacterium]|nr:ETC complex I subunit [Pelagibacterales bacterium]